jgi:hypothetical protein
MRILPRGWFRWRALTATVLARPLDDRPLMLCETTSCGTPFVAVDVGGLLSGVDSPPDRFVAPGDAPGLAGVFREQLSLAIASGQAP